MMELTIADLKADKKQLEKNITTKIAEFEQTYGVKVNHFAIDNVYPADGTTRTARIKLHIDINGI